MAGFNKVFLIGNLTKDPELRYTPSGMAVATFTVASNRNYSTQSGEKKQDVTFLRVVVWGKRGEVCNQYLNKGSQVFVEGRLQTRSWQGQDGTQRNTTEIVANNVQFLGGARGAGSSKHIDEENQEPADIMPEVDMPAGSPRQNADTDSLDDNPPF